MTSLFPDVDIDRKILLIVNSHIQCVSSAQSLKLTLQDHIHFKPVPRCLLWLHNLTSRGRRADVDINREFSLHPGVLYLGVLTIRGLTIRGLTIRGSYDEGFSRSGVLTISGLHHCILNNTSVPSYWSLFLTFGASNERVLHDKSVSVSVLIVNVYI